MTLLSICQDAADTIGIPRPAAVISSSDPVVRRLLGLANLELAFAFADAQAAQGETRALAGPFAARAFKGHRFAQALGKPVGHLVRVPLDQGQQLVERADAGRRDGARRVGR